MEMSRIRPASRATFLSRPFFNWVLCWIILANLAFAPMWLLGGPPRGAEIVATAILGLLVRRARIWVRYLAFGAGLALSLLSTVSALFNLSILSAIASLRFLGELRPSASTEYLVVAVLLVVTVLAAVRLLRRPMDFVAPWELLAAGGLIVMLAAADRIVSIGGAGSYGRTAPHGAPFASAVERSEAVVRLQGRNLVIVMVESLGMPRDPGLRAKRFARWRAHDIARRYDVSVGRVPFFGSTTRGEVRELCGRWGDYPELLDGGQDCLPARLAGRGYRTAAYHSFASDFFDRRDWYPNVGFRDRFFRDEMVAAGAAACPGVFPGACDRDVPGIIGARLRKTAEPQMIYWLSVNSHLPVPIDTSLGTEDCARFDRTLARDHPMSCRLFSLWADLDASLAAMLVDPRLPPTDVLIVGDHSPPFFNRTERLLYEPGVVPWVMLRHRDGHN